MWWTAVNVHLCQFVFSMPAFHTHQSVSSVNWHLRHNNHQRNTCLLDANLSCAVSTSCIISQGLSSQFVAYYSSPSLSTFCLPRGFFSAKMQSCKDEKSFEKGRGKSCQFFARPLFPHCHLESLLQEKKLFFPLFLFMFAGVAKAPRKSWHAFHILTFPLGLDSNRALSSFQYICMYESKNLACLLIFIWRQSRLERGDGKLILSKLNEETLTRLQTSIRWGINKNVGIWTFQNWQSWRIHNLIHMPRGELAWKYSKFQHRNTFLFCQIVSESNKLNTQKSFLHAT